MHIPVHLAALTAFCPLLAVTLPGQFARLQIEPELLLAQAPTIGGAAFGNDEPCELRRSQPLDAFVELSPIHQQMLLAMLRRPADQPVVHGCWLTPPTPAAAALFNAVIQGPGDFQPITRWSSTATSGGGLNQGDPTIITYSFVPDGTLIPNALGEGAANSDLFADFNAAFPNQATWQDRVHDAFDLWGALTGNTYVFEPNDDGADMFGNDGIVGVRGDVRIGGKFIDGGGSILAYNYFPNGGDMVLDTDDGGYYANANDNYRRLFNVIGHEHGHGMGIAHACPTDNTKLMEPFLNTGFDGPQFDDVLSGQRLYGDRLEHNDTAATATDLTMLGNGITMVGTVSVDGTSDTDWFRFDLASTKQITITVSPTGSPYLEGAQMGGSCGAGVLLDPSTLRDLAVELRDASGSSVIASANSQPAGSDEVIGSLLLTAGTYHVRIDGDAVDTIQMYRLDIDVGDVVATATPFGSGCYQGLGNAPTWTAVNTPILGTTQVLRLGNLQNPAGSIGLVLLGDAGIPAGLDLGFIGAAGCNLYVDATTIEVAFPLVGATYDWSLSIPNTMTLSGFRLFTQGALLVTPGSNALGALTANAVELRFGTL